MKTRMKLATVLLLLVLVGGLQTTASAQSVNARENRIVGLWDVQVTISNCDTGAPLLSFWGLHTYELGGTAQIVPGAKSAEVSEHVGVWRYVRDNDYRLDFKEFRFDAAGNTIGWVVVRNKVSINDGATEYRGSGEAEFFDPNGNPLGKVGCPTLTGKRFAAE